MKSHITVKAAKDLLGRCRRRIYQLIEDGDLEAGEFPGTVVAASARKYKRKMDAGKVPRPGRPRNNKPKRKGNGNKVG